MPYRTGKCLAMPETPRLLELVDEDVFDTEALGEEGCSSAV